MIKQRRGNGQPAMGASRDSTTKNLLWSFDKVEVGGLGEFHPTFEVMYGFLYVHWGTLAAVFRSRIFLVGLATVGRWLFGTSLVH